MVKTFIYFWKVQSAPLPVLAYWQLVISLWVVFQHCFNAVKQY